MYSFHKELLPQFLRRIISTTTDKCLKALIISSAVLYQCVCGHHFQQTGHQPGMVTNPACEQGKSFPWPRSRLRVWSRELGSAVPSRVSLLILHTKAESGAYLRDSTSPSRFPLRFPPEPPCAIGLVPSLSGHAIALPMAFTTEN